MATERELPGQSRKYIALPVVRIIFRSLLLPFRHMHEVWKLALATFGVMLGANLIGLFLHRYTNGTSDLLLSATDMLAHAIVIVPFAVAWSKIATDGSAEVEGYGALPLGMTELWYAVANVAMWLLFLLPALPLMHLFTMARQGGDEATIGVAGILALTTMVAMAFAVIRMSFLFPAIATGRYQGVRIAWTQTRGYLESLGAIEGAVCVPFLIIRVLGRHFRSPDEGYLQWFAFYALGEAVFLLWGASFVVGPALAYQFLVLRNDAASETPRTVASALS